MRGQHFANQAALDDFPVDLKVVLGSGLQNQPCLGEQVFLSDRSNGIERRHYQWPLTRVYRKWMPCAPHFLIL